MTCNLNKYKKETKTHYVGKTGNEYSIEEYINLGRNMEGKKDLPKDEYPYTFKYKEEYVWKICRECDCKDK